MLCRNCNQEILEGAAFCTPLRNARAPQLPVVPGRQPAGKRLLSRLRDGPDASVRRQQAEQPSETPFRPPEAYWIEEAYKGEEPFLPEEPAARSNPGCFG